MQTLETELKNIGVKGDEECINFRPSPNFKHMRKYCKSKLKENTSENSCSSSGGEQSPMIQSEEPEKVMVPKTVMVQPPLPPNPPPPDSPLVLKQEIDDSEYSNENEEPKSPTDNVMGDLNRQEENPDKETKTMCRQWARGKCNRGASCVFVHEIIHSQLPEVYTFCKNFQNTRCFFPKCKFVHATVFEKEHYYRTGYLPPHALAHLKENVVQPPPPPTVREGMFEKSSIQALATTEHNRTLMRGSNPPRPAYSQSSDYDSLAGRGGPTDLPSAYSNPPPTIMQPSSNQTLPVGVCGAQPAPPPVTIPAIGSGEPRTVTDVLSTALAVTSPQKREWIDAEDFNVTTLLESGEPIIKKCKKCVMNEFRLQCNKNKVLKMMRASEEMHKKTVLLTKKNEKLYSVLVSLLKTSNAGKENGNVLNTPILNIRNDKEKTMIEQMNMIFSANNRISMSTEEKSHTSSSNISNITSSSNFSSVLVKLLLNNSEQSITTDSS